MRADGEPVVMLHGNPTWSFYYRNLVKALSPKYRAIVPDHMGCGLSAKPDEGAYDFRLESRVADLEALIAHLDLGSDLTLVVHDWGGMIGSSLCCQASEPNPAHGDTEHRGLSSNLHGKRPPAARLRLIRNVAPLAGPAVLGLNLFARGALVMAAKKPLSQSGQGRTDRALQQPAKPTGHPEVRPGHPPGHRRTRATVSPGGPIEGLQALARIPKLICWGQRDFVFDMDYLAQWRRRFPDAEIHCFPDAGHYVLEDAGKPIINLISNFLERYPISMNSETVNVAYPSETHGRAFSPTKGRWSTRPAGTAAGGWPMPT